MARFTNASTRLAHWWQRHPMAALFGAWAVIGTLALSGVLQLWSSRAI
jgi:hypothetical protein